MKYSRDAVGVDLSVIGGLLADPARAHILAALAGGIALPATDLASRAGVTPGTASSHLAKLLAAGWVTAEQQGRHRYYRLVSGEVAALLEHVAALAPPAPVNSLRTQQQTAALRLARSCYDHAAGALGVALTDALLVQDVVRLDAGEFVLTAEGEQTLRMRGIDVAGAARRRRHFIRRCLDWSERRNHLGGALGAAILDAWIDQGWVQRCSGSRVLRLTPDGITQLRTWGVEVSGAGGSGV